MPGERVAELRRRSGERVSVRLSGELFAVVQAVQTQGRTTVVVVNVVLDSEPLENHGPGGRLPTGVRARRRGRLRQHATVSPARGRAHVRPGRAADASHQGSAVRLPVVRQRRVQHPDVADRYCTRPRTADHTRPVRALGGPRYVQSTVGAPARSVRDAAVRLETVRYGEELHGVHGGDRVLRHQLGRTAIRVPGRPALQESAVQPQLSPGRGRPGRLREPWTTRPAYAAHYCPGVD